MKVGILGDVAAKVFTHTDKSESAECTSTHPRDPFTELNTVTVGQQHVVFPQGQQKPAA